MCGPSWGVVRDFNVVRSPGEKASGEGLLAP